MEHNGSCATLEDWFNPARTNDTYVPTGWKGPPGTTTRAVKGHEFGLDLSGDVMKPKKRSNQENHHEKVSTHSARGAPGGRVGPAHQLGKCF